MAQEPRTTYQVKHITISIDLPAGKVYAFAADPINLPRWASGLSTAITHDGDAWRAESPMGTVTVAFSPQNNFGILDHHVTLPNGVTVYNPMRVIANGSGSEVVFTLYQLPGTSKAQFLTDASMVKKDLETLKRILENS